MRVKSTTKEFIERANSTHGFRYDYTESVYLSSREKIAIKCLTHGEFKQSANSHLNGSGCPSCGKDDRYRNRRKLVVEATTSEIVAIAKARAKSKSVFIPITNHKQEAV